MHRTCLSKSVNECELDVVYAFMLIQLPCPEPVGTAILPRLPGAVLDLQANAALPLKHR